MGIIFFLLYFGLAIAQLAAFFAGIELWLGFGAFVGFLIFFVAASLPLGAVFTTAVAFYGAYAGWRWPWWQALLLTCPFLILSLISVALHGAAGIAGMLSGRRNA